jgi:uncharacterized membrane protein (UPF0127 family)
MAALVFTGGASLAYAEEPMRLPVDAQPLTIVTRMGDVRFDVEIADETSERSRGLMHRTDLPAGRGMLFVNEAERAISMWMANTPSPLDMLFIDEDGKVVGIAENTIPFSPAIISAPEPAQYVLELNAGIADKHGIEVGDIVRHRTIAAGK